MSFPEEYSKMRFPEIIHFSVVGVMRVFGNLRIFAPGNHNYKYKKMYIEKIKSPADLKKLDLKELQVVADETRQAVLNRVSKHGGHVGPNLGFVEATVALHYVLMRQRTSSCLT